MKTCDKCGAAATHKVGLISVFCSDCADRAIECAKLEHENSGEIEQHFDTDGLGYQVWRCALCEYRGHENA